MLPPLDCCGECVEASRVKLAIIEPHAFSHSSFFKLSPAASRKLSRPTDVSSVLCKHIEKTKRWERVAAYSLAESFQSAVVNASHLKQTFLQVVEDVHIVHPYLQEHLQKTIDATEFRSHRAGSVLRKPYQDGDVAMGSDEVLFRFRCPKNLDFELSLALLEELSPLIIGIEEVSGGG